MTQKEGLCLEFKMNLADVPKDKLDEMLSDFEGAIKQGNMRLDFKEKKLVAQMYFSKSEIKQHFELMFKYLQWIKQWSTQEVENV